MGGVLNRQKFSKGNITGLHWFPGLLDVNFERRIRKIARILKFLKRNYRAPLAGILKLENREATLVPRLYETLSERKMKVTFKVLRNTRGERLAPRL